MNVLIKGLKGNDEFEAELNVTNFDSPEKLCKFVKPTIQDYALKQKESRAIGFSPNILYSYVDKPSQHYPFIYQETTNCVVIYDVYPKAYLHLLILPKRHFISAQTCSEVSPDHLLQIKEMHDLAREIAHTAEANGLLPNAWKNEDILIGYHTIPSLRPLHIHLISNDLCSPFLKVFTLLY